MRLRLALLLFILFLPALAKLSWWDSSYDYRVCFNVNVTNYSREYWPVEIGLNLTNEIQSTGTPGTINESTLRLVEQNYTNGNYMYEVESQFDKSDLFNDTVNFDGTLSWIMNGTTPAYTIKSYCLYYDTDNKPSTNYQNMSYVWDGEELQVNISIYDEVASQYKGLEYYIDTSRGKNASGIYRIRDSGGSDFWSVPSQSEDPTEFIQYSNGTDTFGFDLQNNMSIIYSGPIRTVVEQKGSEIYWNTTTPAEGQLTKRYTFYNQSQWIVVEQNYSNTAGYSVVRNSTLAGALGFNLTKSSSSNEYFNNIIIGDASEPGSWYWFAQQFANAHIGVINLYNTGNFSSVNRDTQVGKGGIELTNTTIPSGGWIYDKAAIHFNSPQQIRGSPTDAQVKNLRNRLIFAEVTTKNVSEKWSVVTQTSSDYVDYNKGENVTLLVNATIDSGLINLVNATVTSDAGNFDIVLYDDGTHGDSVSKDNLYTNIYTVNVSNVTGVWNISSYAWDQGNLLLNTSNSSFNIQNTYTSALSVINSYGFTNRTVDAVLTLTNYRNDSYVGGAAVNCTYGAGIDAQENVTDYNNGTYFINFTAPSNFDYYDLVCNSTKLNNTGSGTDQFVAIEYVTQVTTYLDFAQGSGDNATFSDRYNFTMLANITNLGNGSAYNLNISISLPPSWISNTTFSGVSDLNLSDSDYVYFELSAPPNTTPGYYILNATTRWKNSDNTTNEVNNTFNISIKQNPLIDMSETLLNHTVSPGIWNFLENITINSLGNYPIENVTFNVTGLTNMTFNFTPSNITSLNQGQSTEVGVWVYIPPNQPLGTYSGFLNATAVNTSDFANVTLNILVTYMGIDTTPSIINSTQMRWYEYENFSILINATNIGTTTALATNITLMLPQANWTTNVTNNTYSCGDVAVGGYCDRNFSISLIQSTPQNYTIVANVSWINSGVGMAYNTTNITIVVNSNKEFIINETSVAGSAPHGTSTVVGQYTLINTGNDQINGMGVNTFNLTGFSVTYDPVVNFMPAGTIVSVNVNVSTPIGKDPGLYLGSATVNSADGGLDTINLNITVPISRSWVSSPSECLDVEVAFDTGTMCSVFFNNTGNVPINFTISPSATNYTYPNATNFTVPKQSSYLVDFLWDLTGFPRDYYNSTYNVSVISGSPLWSYFNLSMVPRELAEINASFSKNITEELETFTINVNVTDKSGTGINQSYVQIFKPDNSVDTLNLIQTNVSNNSYEYYTNYPSGSAISDAFGNYTVQVVVQDNLGLTSRLNLTKYVYPALNISIDTVYDTYFLGESASLYVNTTDVGKTIIDSNVSMSVYDGDNNLRYHEDLTTSGKVEPIPIFTIPSDAPIGNYSVRVNATHTDPYANETVVSSNNYTFSVRENYNIEFDTSLVWYPDSTMNFYTLLYGDRPFPSPDKINLTVYDPAQNTYFTTESFSQFTASNTSTLYTYSYAMPVNSPVGYYLAVLTVEEGGRQIKKLESFRVTYGGPFDVVILNNEPEVPIGESQDFDVLLENMGDFGQDVYMDYWIEKNGTIYDEVTGEAIFVAAGGNRTLNRSLNIFSNQPVGNYTLHVKLNYSKVSPVIEVTKNFLVVASASGEKKPPVVLEPVEAAVIELTVTNLFPDQLILNRGSVGYLTIELKNTGNIDLTDITAFFEDIDKEWFEVVRNVDILSAGKSGYLVVKFSIPDSASARTYVTKMRIIAKELEVSEFYKVLVFKTQEEALRARINTLQSELLDLEDQTGQVAARGGDVTKILSLLRKSRELLDVADTYLQEDSTVDAIKTISEAEGVIEEIKYRLEIAKPDFLPTVLLPQVPTNWYLILIFIAVIVLVAVIALKKFNVFRDKERRTSLLKIKNTLTKSREANEYSDVYDAIKDQYEEGMISRETFEELKELIK